MNTQRIRLDKLLSELGISSRKDARKILRDNEVTIDSIRVTKPNVHIDPNNDEIRINGEKIEVNEYVYYLVHKPEGIISSTVEEHGSESVLSLVPDDREVYPVGRLDKETTGLVLLTNNGELTHKLIHPKYHIPKTYVLTITGKVSKDQLSSLTHGVELKDGITAPAEARVVNLSEEMSQLELTIYEGRNRQIRRMCEKLGIELLHLHRIQFGPLKLGDLAVGMYRTPSDQELQRLNDAVSPQR